MVSLKTLEPFEHLSLMESVWIKVARPCALHEQGLAANCFDLRAMPFSPKTNSLDSVDYGSSFLAASKLGPVCSLRRVVLDLVLSFLRDPNHGYSVEILFLI
jgi:hypothetical protein